MKAINVIENVLDTALLIPEMIRLPKGGASDNDINIAEANLQRPLSEQHKMLLRKWNGIGLDVIRIYCCGSSNKSISDIVKRQHGLLSEFKGYICFADSPSGIMYAESDNGQIFWAHATDLDAEKIADNIDDFISNFIFGERAALFSGEEWVDELKEAGLL
jgi:hypothetical protein